MTQSRQGFSKLPKNPTSEEIAAAAEEAKMAPSAASLVQMFGVRELAASDAGPESGPLFTVIVSARGESEHVDGSAQVYADSTTALKSGSEVYIGLADVPVNESHFAAIRVDTSSVARLSGSNVSKEDFEAFALHLELQY